MKAVFKVAFNNIKKKKVQNILILLIMIVAAVLFSSSLNFISSVDKPFRETHSKLNGFDNILYMNPAKEDVQKVAGIYKNSNKVKTVSVGEGYNSSEYAVVNGKKMNQVLRLQEKDDRNKGIDKLDILQGDEGMCPKNGEVWLSKGMADDNGIKLNDYIEFNVNGKKIKEKVGAIVVDSCFSQPTLGILRFWINKDELERTIPRQDIIKVISVVLKTSGDGNDINVKIDNTLGRPINASRVTYSDIESGCTMLYKIIGRVMLALTGFILIFTFVIIMITIANTIFNDYKNIGIIETLGFSKIQIMLCYVMQFFILSVIASLIGAAIGSFSSSKLLQKYYMDFGFSSVNINCMETSVITIAAIIVFVLIFSAIASISILKVSPVEAIRQGKAPSSQEDRNLVSLMSLKRINLFFSVGIKNILGNLRQNLLLFLAICASIYITSFCINSKNVLNNAYKNPQSWGFEKSNLSMTANPGVSKDKIKNDVNEIKNNPDVESVSSFYYYSLITIPKTQKLPSNHIYTAIYDNDFDKDGLINIKGRNPKKSDEISIGAKISEEYNKGVGDYFKLYVNGKEKTFLITGIYESMIHFGESVRVNEDALSDCDENFKNTIPIQISIVAKNKNDIERILKSTKEKYGSDYKVEEGNQYLKGIGQMSFSAAGYALTVVAISFIIIAVFCIFNLNLINIYSFKKDFGIFKALGMEDREINMIYVYKMLMLIIISVAITIPIGMLTHGPVLNIVLSTMAIRNLPVPMCFTPVLASCAAFTVLVIIAVIISCKAIANINGRDLISE